MNEVLKVENVCKNYGQFKALDDVSLTVSEGCIFGLLGPNGAGKTTLIRIINQISMPDSGSVLLSGKKLGPKHIRDIGYLPEERGLYKSMKVGEQVMYLAQLKGMSKKDAKKRLDYWFEKFEISDWWNKKIQELSKGMAQKVQFIVTVLHNPKLLIFDEPFSGFDPINANIIKDEILELKKAGSTIIFSTHRMESVEEICEEIALLDKANKILDGRLDQIKQEYKENEFMVGLMSKHKDKLLTLVKQKFETEILDEKQGNHDLGLKIKLNKNESSTELIKFLNSKAEITHFAEIIPNANDIFLKAVANHG
jgi:ABC-2 type transport system ATP-binding protein